MILKYIVFVIFLFCLSFATFATFATNYYVSSSTGSDGNVGTQVSPYATLAKIKTLTLNPGDSVFLKGGDIFFETLYANHSGSSGSPIVYTTYGTGRAIISGFTTLSSWTSMGNNIYESLCTGCTVRTNILTLDANVQSMGRWPDTGWRTYSAITLTSITDASLSSSPYNWTSAYACVHDEFYIVDTASITAQTSSSLTFGSSLSIANSRGKGYFIMRDPRTLLLTSRIGSWYFNNASDSMQVYFGSGGTTGHTVKVSTKDTLLYCSSVNYLTFNNLDLEGSNEFSVFVNNATGITITNCLLNYGGGNAVQGNNCPSLICNNDSIQNFQNNAGYITNASTHNIVSNCYIKNIGIIPGMGRTVGGNGGTSYSGWSNLLGFNSFYNNTFLNIGYDCISWDGDSVNIYNNFLDTFCLVKIDGGGLYTNDGTTQSYVYGRNIYNNIILNGQTISSNAVVMDTTDVSFGIYCDGHSSLLSITGNNSSYNISGGILIKSTATSVLNNTCFNNKYSQIYVQENGNVITGLNLKNNTLGVNTLGQHVLTFTTTGSDLNTFGVCDSNYFAGITGVTSPFLTKQTGDIGTNRTLSSWTSNIGYDTHSSLQTGNLTLNYNPITSSNTFFFQGLYKDVIGNSYNQSVTLQPFSSLLLFILNCGCLNLTPGSRVLTH